MTKEIKYSRREKKLMRMEQRKKELAILKEKIIDLRKKYKKIYNYIYLAERILQEDKK